MGWLIEIMNIVLYRSVNSVIDSNSVTIILGCSLCIRTNVDY